MCLLLPVLAAAQSKPEVTEVVTDHLRIRYDPRVAVASDGSISLAVEIAPRPRMHVYAPGKHDYRVITMSCRSPRAFDRGRSSIPRPRSIISSLSTSAFPCIRNRSHSKWRRGPVRPPRGPPLKVAGHLDYQACDDQVCFAPVSVPLAWTSHDRRQSCAA